MIGPGGSYIRKESPDQEIDLPVLNILPHWIKVLKRVLARWFLAMPWHAEAGRHGMAKPPTATGSGFVDDGPGTDTSIASQDDDGSSPFPPGIRHRHGKSDSDPPPPWWKHFTL
jgi:hypothetical protein